MSIFGAVWLWSAWQLIAYAISQAFFSLLCRAKFFSVGDAAQA